MGSVCFMNYPVKASGKFGTQKGPLSRIEPREAAGFTEFPHTRESRCYPVEECFYRLFLHVGKSGAGVAEATTHTTVSAGRNGREWWHQHGPALTRMWT